MKGTPTSRARRRVRCATACRDSTHFVRAAEWNFRGRPPGTSAAACAGGELQRELHLAGWKYRLIVLAADIDIVACGIVACASQYLVEWRCLCGWKYPDSVENRVAIGRAGGWPHTDFQPAISIGIACRESQYTGLMLSPLGNWIDRLRSRLPPRDTPGGVGPLRPSGFRTVPARHPPSCPVRPRSDR